MPTHDELITNTQLLTGAQACQILAISERTLWSWKERGLLTYYRIGRTIRFKLADINLALEGYREGGALGCR